VKPAPSTKNFKALVKRLDGAALPPVLPGSGDPVSVLIQSFLLWEASAERAAAAYRRLIESVVDFNDLRVTMPSEIVELIGERYPNAAERAQRLRAALRDVYLREHEMSLLRLQKLGKREVKKYVETLDGIVPYVAARLLLLCFETHSLPVDEQLRRRLVETQVADAGIGIDDLAAWLTRQVKPEDGVRIHHALQAWVDSGPARARGRGRPGRTAAEATPAAVRSTRGAGRSRAAGPKGGAASGHEGTS
jgi:endonuclease III